MNDFFDSELTCVLFRKASKSQSCSKKIEMVLVVTVEYRDVLHSYITKLMIERLHESHLVTCKYSKIPLSTKRSDASESESNQLDNFWVLFLLVAAGKWPAATIKPSNEGGKLVNSK